MISYGMNLILTTRPHPHADSYPTAPRRPIRTPRPTTPDFPSLIDHAALPSPGQGDGSEAPGNVIMRHSDKPQFGDGTASRPPRTVRDRDAEAIRRVLRMAGRRELGADRGGFVVEGGYRDYPFLVACAD